MKDIDVSKLLDQSRDKDYLYGTTDRYDWSQNEHEVEMHVKLPVERLEEKGCNTLTKKDVSCVIKSEKVNLPCLIQSNKSYMYHPP